MPDSVKLQLHAEVADGLRRLDKGATHVVIANQGLTVGDVGFGRVTDSAGDTRIWDRHNDVGIHGMFAGKQPPQHFPRLRHVAAEYDRIGTREVDVLEYAMRPVANRSVAFPSHSFGADD